MAIIGALTAQVTADTTDFERGMQRTRQEVDRTSQSITSAARQWQASLLNKVTFGAIGTENIEKFLVSLDEASAHVEAMRASLTRVSGSQVGGGEAFAMVSQQADQAGASLQGLAQQYANLAAVTRGTDAEGATTNQLFQGLTNAATRYAVGLQQSTEAQKIFQSILSSGKVTAADWHRLLLAFPEAQGLMERATGKSAEELKKWIDKGADALEFTRAFARQLSGEMPTALQTSQGAMQRLQDQLTQLKAQWNEPGWIEGLLARFRAFQGGMATIGADILKTGRVPGLGQVFTGTEENEAGTQRRARLLERELGVASPEEARELMRLYRRIPAQLGVEPLSLSAGQSQAFVTLREQLAQRAREQEQLQGDVGATTQRETAIDKQVKDNELIGQMRDILKTIPTELAKVNEEAALTPTLFEKNQQQLTFFRQKLTELQKPLKDIGAGTALPADVTAGFRDVERQAGAAQSGLDAIAKAKADAAAAEAKRKQEEAQAEQDRLNAREAVFRAGQRAKDQDAEAIRQLQQLHDALTLTTEDRQIQQAQALARRYLGSEEMQQDQALLQLKEEMAGQDTAIDQSEEAQQARKVRRLAEIVQTYAQLRQEAGPRLAAMREENAETMKANELDDERLSRLRLMVAQAEAEKEQRPEIRARAIAAEITDEDKRTEAEALQSRLGIAVRAQQEAKLLERAGAELESFFMQLATSGKLSFASVAESFTRMTLSILADQANLKKVFGELLGKGINAIGGLFQGSSFTTTGTTGSTLAGTEEIIASVPGLASGGPASAGRMYMVGERGPELFRPSMPGTIIPNRQLRYGGARAQGGYVMPEAYYSVGEWGAEGFQPSMGGRPGRGRGTTGQPISVTMHVYGVRDAQSFQYSMGAINRKMAQSIQRAQRDQ